MSWPEFHANVWANIAGAIIFALAVWAWVKHRGGRCPLCNQRQA